MNNGWDKIWPRIVQVAGLGIAIYETVVERVDRPSLLLLAAGMIGIDKIHRAAKKLSKNGD